MILAPMQGLTEVLFRRVYEECFPGAIQKAVSPFLSLTHNLHYSGAESAKYSDVLPENNEGSIPLTPQILGKEPEEFVALGNMLYDMGYQEVNWNMGCPMRKVTAKHRGSGILPYPDEIREILDNVLPRLKPRLSVKVRLGLKSRAEIFAVMPVLNQYPLVSVTIHPRLGRQQYSGVPDLDTFGEVLPTCVHPVIYNGDICTAADARRIMERFPSISDIMIGRGVLYSPTLPLQIAGDECDIDNMSRHFVRRLMEEIDKSYHNDESKIRKTKEYWCLMWRSLPISEMQARTVLRCHEYDEVLKMILHFLQYL